MIPQRIAVVCVALTTTVFYRPVGAQLVDLNQAIALAQQHSPRLQAAQLQLFAAQTRVANIADLPSPKLTIGHVNQPITGSQAWQVNQSMMSGQRIALQQNIPNTAKRLAAQQIAQRQADVLAQQSMLDQIDVEQAVATAWLTVFFTQKKQLLTEDLLRETARLAQAIQLEVSQNQRPLADGVLAAQQAARWQDQRGLLQTQVEQAKLDLLRWTRLAEVVVDSNAEWQLPELPIADWLKHLTQHTVLGVARAEVNLADANLQLSQRQYALDWGVELAYQHRSAQFGELLSLQVSVDLPFFRSAQIQAEQLAAQQRLTAQQQQQEDIYLMHRLHLERQAARLDLLAQQLERLHSSHLPLAQQRIQLTQAGYASRQLPLSSVIQARLEHLQQQFRLLELQQEQAVTATQLLILHQSTGDHA